mgnify:CR=1 FL=1
MLRTASHLKGTTIAATDGEIGSVQDLYFDDHGWTIRYLMVDTGTWLPGRQVLISPIDQTTFLRALVARATQLELSGTSARRRL